MAVMGVWKPQSGEIVLSFGQGTCTFDCQWSEGISKIMALATTSQQAHVFWELRNWSPSTWLVCGHFIQIHSCMGICFSCMHTNNYKH